MMARYARLAIGVAFAGLFLWLIFRHVGWRDVVEGLRAVDASLLAAAVLAFLVGYACRIERWRLMLLQGNPSLQWGTCAGPFMESIAANNVLPFRAGDVLRAFAFTRQLGVSSTTTVSSLIVERLLDLLMIALFLGLAISVFGTGTSRLVGVSGGVIAVSALAILCLLLVPRLLRLPASAVVAIASLVSTRLADKLGATADRLIGSLAMNAAGHTMPRLAAWSLLAWTAEGCVFWLTALALPTLEVPHAAWAALPVATLATVIPSTPGYVGTFDYFAAGSMTALGNGAVAAATFALLIHFVLWLPPTLIGGAFFLLRLSKPRSQLPNAPT